MMQLNFQSQRLRLLLLLLVIFVMGCGRSGFKVVEVQEEEFSLASTQGSRGTEGTGGSGGGSTGGVDPVIVSKADESSRTSLLTGDQLLRSMSDLTAVPVDAAITTEYQRLRAAFGESYDLKKVTGPMLMSLTSLSGVYCNKSVAREATLAAGSRAVYKRIDFNRPVSDVSGAVLSNTVQDLALRFWGRSASDAEVAMMTTARDEFVQAIARDANAASHTRALAVFLCTAALSSFDSLSL